VFLFNRWQQPGANYQKTLAPHSKHKFRCCRHWFSKVLSVVILYSKCTRALTFENVCCALQGKMKFSKVLSVVFLYGKCTRALTFENVCCALQGKMSEMLQGQETSTSNGAYMPICLYTYMPICLYTCLYAYIYIYIYMRCCKDRRRPHQMVCQLIGIQMNYHHYLFNNTNE